MDKLTVLSVLAVSAATLVACKGGGEMPAPTPTAAETACTGLNNQAFVTAEGTARVSVAVHVSASVTAPEHCRVSGSMPPALQFDVRLPTIWNQRLLYIGGGGFDGVIPEPPRDHFQQGYAIVASNGGHPLRNDESWALDPEQLNDFAYRSVHKTLGAARLIIQQRYSQAPARSYFEGCSNGGREALIQAQRYPADFDGIVARAPAWNFTWLMVAGNKSMQTFFASPATQLSAAKINFLSNAVLATCDALDNVVDGVVSNPARCVFDPTVLRCPAGIDNNTCLTDAQLATVSAMYAPFRLANNTPYYIGWPPGGESDPSGWPFWVASQNSGLPSFSTRFIQYFLQLGANYDAMSFVPDNHLPILQGRAALLDASSTDYSAYRARGGKLILWHGTNDWAISHNSTALYYNNIVQAAGGQAAADQFVELFSAPGVQHCFGGAGSDVVDLLTPLRAWVEGGTPPSQQNLVAVKVNLQTLATTNPRPLCKFPLYPRYNGTGAASVASSYTCSAP